MTTDREKKLLEEVERLRIKCGPEEMIEGDYATLIMLAEENRALRKCLKHSGVLSQTLDELHALLRTEGVLGLSKAVGVMAKLMDAKHAYDAEILEFSTKAWNGSVPQYRCEIGEL